MPEIEPDRQESLAQIIEHYREITQSMSALNSQQKRQEADELYGQIVEATVEDLLATPQHDRAHLLKLAGSEFMQQSGYVGTHSSFESRFYFLVALKLLEHQ